MKTKKTAPIVVGNWKMNPEKLSQATTLLAALKSSIKKLHGPKLRLAVPTLYVTTLVKQSGTTIEIGVQNIHSDTIGAHTGEISGPQAVSAGACFTILGHSERRASGETNADIHLKLTAALKAKLDVVLCIGESVRDHDGAYLQLLRSQLELALQDVSQKAMQRIIIAYEPIWAIGKLATAVATPTECQEVSILIRRTLSDLYTDSVSKKCVVLYGGSVSSDNALGFLCDGGVQGFLLGRASLDAVELEKIITL